MRNVLVPPLAAAAVAIAAFLPQQVSAAVPPVDGAGRAALIQCPTTLTVPGIYHFDKIVFVLTPNFQIQAVNAADQPALNAIPRGVPLDIKVIDNPRTIANLKAKVLSFLGARVNSDTLPGVTITNVLYATAVCNPKGW
ncbi:MAG: hypothetical protein HC855_12390 [Rhizobiales bacterium]|nr:hypothetical protein [Hyphomicrobiales bacterium]